MSSRIAVRRRGAGLGAELEVLQVRQRRGGAGRPLERDHRLGSGVVAIGEVDDLRAGRGDRDLVDVEVELLVAGRVGVVERHLDPGDVGLVEAELVGDGVGHGRLEALAVGRLVVAEPRLVRRGVGADGQRSRRVAGPVVRSHARGRPRSRSSPVVRCGAQADQRRGRAGQEQRQASCAHGRIVGPRSAQW